jgi:hypothetical protein
MSSLTIHEWHAEDGSRETVEVGAEDGALVVRVSGVETHLPMVVLEKVMERYGKPLADGVPLTGPSVDLGGGSSLHVIRHLGLYDVIARDFVVWCSPGREPLAELATGISAALAHFANAAKGS